MRVRRLLAGCGIAALALGDGAAPAAAHPTPEQAAPAPGLSAPSAPAAIQLAFSEAAVPRGSRIVVRGPRGAVATGPRRRGAGGRADAVVRAARPPGARRL